MDEVLYRTIPGGFMPMSPAATTHDAILSNVIAGIFGSKPGIGGVDALLDVIDTHCKGLEFGSDERELVRAAVTEFYTRASTGSRGKSANRYAVPFHPNVARSVRPAESRAWGQWYLMLMSRVDPPEFNQELHDLLVARLESLEPSNILEALIVEAVGESYTDRPTRIEAAPKRPYTNEIAQAFQADLDSWLANDADFPSDWLLGLGKLVTTYILIDFVQLALNLRDEFQAIEAGREFRPGIVPVYFGSYDESAGQDRPFSNEWKDAAGGIEQALYESWGRLSVTRLLNAKTSGLDHPPRRASEILAGLEEPERSSLKQLLHEATDHLKGTPQSDTVDAAVIELADQITKFYLAKKPANQTPLSLGVKVVLQLGDGTMPLIRTQTRVGKTFRLSQDLLSFWAKIATRTHQPIHFRDFVAFLKERGIYQDGETERLTLQVLDEMGLIERQSDSGDAVYVRGF